MTSSLLAMNDVAVMPTQNEWQLMTQMAQQLVPTGFLPKAIDTPQKAVAVMLKSLELKVPFMYGLAHISIINGKPTTDAELMLALVQRDHGTGAMRVKSSDEKHCTVEYKVAGWGNETSEYTFAITDATRAGLNTDVWKKYPAAMLRARCISAVARMAFPAAIGGMYVAGELGDDVEVNEDGEVHSVSVNGFVVEQQPIAIEEPKPKVDTELADAKSQLWKTANGKYGWSVEALNDVGDFILGAKVSEMAPAGLHDLNTRILGLAPDAWKAIADGADVASVLTATQEQLIDA